MVSDLENEKVSIASSNF